MPQAHCNSQMCVPTRNSFMTGRRPDTTRVFNDGIGNDNFRVTGPDWTTLPQAFKEAGYFVTGAPGARPPSPRASCPCLTTARRICFRSLPPQSQPALNSRAPTCLP